MLPVYRNVTGGLGWQKKSSLVGTQTIFALLCSIFVKRMSKQPRLCFSWTMPLATLKTSKAQHLDVSDVYMPRNTTSLFQPMDWG